ncbi:MAG: cupin domain-containing protein, partial [Acidobacteriota bacterium]
MNKPIEINEAKVESFDLEAVTLRLRDSEEYVKNGRSAQTVVKGPDLTATVVMINAGVELGEHAAPASAMLVVLDGEINFISGGSERRVAKGCSVVFAGGERHSVRGVEESAFL